MLRGAVDLTNNWGKWRSFLRTHRLQWTSIRNWWWWWWWLDQSSD